MPTVDQILSGLKEIANTWKLVAIMWHVYFAALALSLIVGFRPSKRTAGILLLLPLSSVSIIAWISGNPFNGILYALISILLLVVSLRLPTEKVGIAPPKLLIPGIFIFIFGWIYPHFLTASSFLSYLVAAPIGLIPCATLSIAIGSALILNGLNSRAYLLILGIPGLFFGITGVFQLKVIIDLILLLGALIAVGLALVKKPKNR